MDLTNVPDLVLLEILKRLPLHILLEVVSLVCRRWNCILPSILARRRTLWLKITYNSNYTKSAKQKHCNIMKLLVFHRIGDSIAHGITASFRFVRSLLISFWGTDVQVEQILHLLTHYRTQLNELKLYGLPEHCRTDQLYQLLNTGMPALKRFTLSRKLGESVWSLSDLTILLQLEYFRLDCADLLWESLESIVKHANASTTLKTIELCAASESIGCVPIGIVDRLMQLKPETASKVKHLGLLNDYDLDKQETLDLLCARFTSLKFLSLESRISLPCTLASLCPLEHLEHLTLSFEYYKYLTHSYGRFTLSAAPSYQFRSLQTLDLRCSLLDHSELDKFDFGHTFPALRKFNLINISDHHCSICVPRLDETIHFSKSVFEHPVMNCLKMQCEKFVEQFGTEQLRKVGVLLRNRNGRLTVRTTYPDYSYTTPSVHWSKQNGLSYS